MTHQALHRAPGYRHAFPLQLTPHLAGTLDPVVLLPDALHLPTQDGIALRPAGAARRISRSCLVRVIGGWGDRQHRADRLDPVLGSMVIDELDHHFVRRSSSAWAKYAAALRRISLARCSSRFCRSSSCTRRRSSLVTPCRWPLSTSYRRTHLRRVSAVQPIFAAIELIAAHGDGYSDGCSCTIRTVRSRLSLEYCGAFSMTPIAQRRESPATPERFIVPNPLPFVNQEVQVTTRREGIDDIEVSEF